MDEVILSVFKAKCVEMLKHAHKHGRPLRVTRRGTPLAAILPSRYAQADERKKLGAMRDLITTKGDIVNFSSTDDWEALHD